MPRATRAWWLWIGCLWSGCLLSGCLLSGCTVQRPAVDDRPFPCASDEDCLEGFDCVDRSMLGLPGFCAASCDPRRPTETCPLGLCTPDGACLTRCIPERDGSLRVGCPNGLSCVRTDLFRDDGVCWDITGCSVGSECDGEATESSCLSELLGVPALVSGLSIASNRLYCVVAPEGPLRDRCAVGSIPIPGRAGYPGACLPTCNDAGDRCPPAMSCWRDLGWVFGAVQESVCWVGTWGALCESDEECLLGRCVDVGDRSICTERCSDVPIGGGCEALADASFYVPGRSEWSCRAVGSDAYCVPRGGIGAPCGADRPCLDALDCLLFMNESTGICSRGCDADSDCYLDEIPEPRRSEVYCTDTEANHVCWPQGGAATNCTSGRQCLSGRCVGGICASSTRGP